MPVATAACAAAGDADVLLEDLIPQVGLLILSTRVADEPVDARALSPLRAGVGRDPLEQVQASHRACGAKGRFV
jgi:hypothetical protein